MLKQVVRIKGLALTVAARHTYQNSLLDYC